MPLAFVDPPDLLSGSTATPDSISRLVQRAGTLATRGDPLAPPPEPGEAPSFMDTATATFATSWMGSAASRLARTFESPGNEAFDPFDFIRGNPELMADPYAAALVERGQFDEVDSREDFWRAYLDGRDHLDSLDVMGRASWFNRTAAMLGVGLMDPSNVLPLGFAAKAMQTGSTLIRAGKFAGLGAGVGLGFKRLDAALQPASDDPGILDDVLAAGTMAALSGGIGLITSPAIADGIGGYVATRKVRQLRRDLEEAIKGPGAVHKFDPNLKPGTVPDTSSLADEVVAGRDLLTRALAEDATDNRVVAALRQPGDENDVLLGKLREKYAAAGKTLHVVDHPDAWYFDLVGDVEAILNHPGLTREATPEDFDAGWLDAAVSSVTSRYANLASVVTPGGRLATATLGRLQDVYRTLSGSAQTITAGSARDPLHFESGAAAESIKSIYDAQREATIIDLRKLHSAARRSGPITYGGQTIGPRDYKGYTAAVLDFMRRENAKARGFPDSVPADVHSSIREGAARVRAYFLRMRDEAEGVGMLDVGPRALADLEAKTPEFAGRVERVKTALVRAEERLTKAKAGPLETPGEVRLSKTAVERELSGVIHPDLLHPGHGAGQTVRPSVVAELERTVAGEGGLGDYERLMALTHMLDRTGQLNASAGARLVGLDPKTLTDGDTWRLDGEFDFQVVGVEGDRLIVQVVDQRKAIPLGDGEYLSPEPMEFTVGLDKPLPANAGTLTRDGAAVPGVNVRAATAEARLNRLREQLPRAEGRAAEHAKRVESMKAAVESQSTYLPRVYKVPELLSREAEFVARMADQFNEASLRVNGRRVLNDERPLLPEVAVKLDQTALDVAAVSKRGRLGDLTGLTPDAIMAERVRGVVEGDLPESLRAAYRAELDAYYVRNARAAFAKLTEPTERHGVADAIKPGDPLKRRVVDVDDSAIADFLEPDLESILHRYSASVGGRVAVRRSIQLNGRIWNGVKLKDGRPIVDGSDLLEYLAETTGALDRFARVTHERAGRTRETGAAAGRARGLSEKVQRDIGVPLSIIEGRNFATGESPIFDAFAYMGRMAMRATFLSKMGSVAWSQISDLAPLSLGMMAGPHRLRAIPDAMLGLKGLPQRDLEVLGLAFEGITRTRALADTDALATNLGTGSGAVRRATARAEAGVEAAADLFGRATLMRWITQTNKRVAGVVVIDRLTQGARRMARAAVLVDRGMAMDAALKTVGLSTREAAWLNKVGINGERAKLFERLLWEHGLARDDRRIRDFVSFDVFSVSPRHFGAQVLKPNLAEWDLSKPGARDLYDTLTANLAAEVDRSMVVTPGAFDRPIINQRILGRMFNQFGSFAAAFANQRLRVMAQMPASHQAWYGMSYLALGAVSDAISNHLSGRRTLDETIGLWKSNPMGMVYAAFRRSGLDGWLGRPLSVADAMGVPFSPGNLTANLASSAATSHVSNRSPLTYLGPVAADLDQLAQLGGRISRGELDRRTAYIAWKLAPTQNLLWWRMMHRLTGAPVVPESLIQDQLQRREIRP